MRPVLFPFRRYPSQAAFFKPSTSICWIDGGCDRRSGACAISACAIGPLKWAWRPASSLKASKMPKVAGPSRSANQIGVVSS